MDPYVLEDYRSEASELSLACQVPLLYERTLQSVSHWASLHHLGRPLEQLLARAHQIFAPDSTLAAHCSAQLAQIEQFVRFTQDPQSITQAQLGTLYLQALKAHDQLQTAIEVINQLLLEPAPT